MSPPANVRRMDDKDVKQLEGQRIMAALGGIAAVPGAGLIYMDAPGAPLFAAALVLVAGAYVCWLFTDGVYFLSVLARNMGKFRLFFPVLNGLGQPLSVGTIMYGGASLLSTLAGFLGAHGSWRVPVSVEAGFVLAALLGLVMLGHVMWARQRLEQLRDLVRRYSYVYRRRVEQTA